jgi:hypothetical protein
MTENIADCRCGSSSTFKNKKLRSLKRLGLCYDNPVFMSMARCPKCRQMEHDFPVGVQYPISPLQVIGRWNQKNTKR